MSIFFHWLSIFKLKKQKTWNYVYYNYSKLNERFVEASRKVMAKTRLYLSYLYAHTKKSIVWKVVYALAAEAKRWERNEPDRVHTIHYIFISARNTSRKLRRFPLQRRVQVARYLAHELAYVKEMKKVKWRKNKGPTNGGTRARFQVCYACSTTRLYLTYMYETSCCARPANLDYSTRRVLVTLGESMKTMIL